MAGVIAARLGARTCRPTSGVEDTTLHAQGLRRHGEDGIVRRWRGHLPRGVGVFRTVAFLVVVACLADVGEAKKQRTSSANRGKVPGASSSWFSDFDGTGRRRRTAGSNNSTGKKGRRKDNSSAPVRAVITILANLAIMCGGCITWCLYLEKNPRGSNIRFWLYTVLLLFSSVELGCVLLGMASPWMLLGLFVTNVWGSLDAVLRYPIVHEFDTIFSFKQLALLIVKVVVYVLSFYDIYDSKLAFSSLILQNVIGLPLIYLLSLPLDDSALENKRQAEDVVDVDILVRGWRLLRDRDERQLMLLGCRRRAQHCLLSVCRCLPGPAQGAVASVSPMLKRSLQAEKGRSV